ncbi:Hypothetical predicted protein [Podarcis lilfordi]|uniref:Uncharacterized protein n=1 Tax=Podarcis lilfordi TaxID=74358 RepID=A0AA35LGQ4_9SAUR|nr:Hypothetical predicted protein [Podarcis lilfordi]
MGHRHSKWSVHSKEREPHIPKEKYTATTIPSSLDAPRSHDTFMCIRDNDSSMASTEETRQLRGANMVPQATQEEVLPVQQEAKAQPVSESPQKYLNLKQPQLTVMLEKGIGAFQPTITGVHEAELATQRPPHLGTYFLVTEEMPSKERALEDQESLVLTPSGQSMEQISEGPRENVRKVATAMKTIWTVDHEDAEVQTTTELEEHPHCCTQGKHHEEEDNEEDNDEDAAADSSRLFTSYLHATKWTR